MSGVIYKKDGDAVNYTPVAAVAAGDVVVQGSLVGVAKLPIAAGALGALHVVGVFQFPKATGSSSAITAGALVYWDDSADVATTTSSGNTLIGKCTLAGADAVATIEARLDQ